MRVTISLSSLFPDPWLEEKAEGDPDGRTNRELQTEVSFLVFVSCATILILSGFPETTLRHSAATVHWRHLADGGWTNAQSYWGQTEGNLKIDLQGRYCDWR